MTTSQPQPISPLPPVRGRESLKSWSIRWLLNRLPSYRRAGGNHRCRRDDHSHAAAALARDVDAGAAPAALRVEQCYDNELRRHARYAQLLDPAYRAKTGSHPRSLTSV